MCKIEFNLNLLRIGKPKKQLLIKGINFNLDKNNKIVALIGESGLGKTTIYKSLFSTYINLWNKQYPIDFKCNHKIKNCLYSDKEIKDGIVKLNFGFATQVPYFFEDKSVEYNLFFPLKWIKEIKDTEEFRKKYLQKFELTELGSMEMNLLSGGQRQMVNIARVFLSNPDLVIIDESLSNIDEKKAEKYIQLILENYKNTFIFLTSHREADINYCKALKINLVKKKDESGVEYITIVK